MSSRTAMKMVFVLALLLPSLGSAEDPLERSGWKLISYRLGRQFFLKANPANPDGERGPIEIVKPIAGSKGRYDTRDWYRAAGVTFPEGAFAIFDDLSSSLVCYAPNEVIDLMETLCISCGGTVSELRFDATMAEFAVAPDAPLDDLSFVDLRKVAGSTWRELERVTSRGRSGHRIQIEQVTRKPALKRSKLRETDGTLFPLSAEDRGWQMEIEPVLGPDGITFDLNLMVRHRGAVGENGPVLDVELNTSLEMWDDYPTVVTLWTVAPAKKYPDLTRHVALIIRPHVVNPGGWFKVSGKKPSQKK